MVASGYLQYYRYCLAIPFWKYKYLSKENKVSLQVQLEKENKERFYFSKNEGKTIKYKKSFGFTSFIIEVFLNCKINRIYCALRI